MVILINTKERTEDILFGVQKQQLNHLSDSESAALKKLCFLSKNMYNVALYNARQHYFSNGKFMTIAAVADAMQQQNAIIQ